MACFRESLSKGFQSAPSLRNPESDGSDIIVRKDITELLPGSTASFSLPYLPHGVKL